MNPRIKASAFRGGFTLVELLVVIGIIVVLIAMVAAGVRHTRFLVLRHTTQVRLKVCEDILAEYKAINGYKNVLGPADSVTTGTPIRLPSAWITGQYDAPIFVYPKNNGSIDITAQVNNPVSTLILDNFKGSVDYRGNPGPEYHGNMNEATNPNDPRWVADAVRWTQGVMFILLKDPRNRALISNLPSECFLETMHAPVDSPTSATPGRVIGKRPVAFTIDAAVILDGWQNPIVFVPPGGMHVWMNPGGQGLREWVVRTSGTYDLARPLPPVGPNDRPFFASTGPDGYFTDSVPGADDFASDNMYSFRDL